MIDWHFFQKILSEVTMLTSGMNKAFVSRKFAIREKQIQEQHDSKGGTSSGWAAPALTRETPTMP